MNPSRHYLVQYGRLGHVGRFASDLAMSRGARVVVRSPRGEECGEVLVSPQGTSAGHDGEVLRLATPDDDATVNRRDSEGRAILDLVSTRSAEAGLPLAFIDIEVMLDGIAILHTLPWDACDVTPILDAAAAESGLTVRLLDLSSAPIAKDPTGCGKPGCGTESGGCSTCGTGGGGCSTGSCSRGSVKSADELTGYFAGLRRQMENAGMVRTPLN